MKFRKKPVEIEAVQFTNELALKLFANEEKPIFGLFTPCGQYHLENNVVYNAYIMIDTLEGRMKAELNDWIIKGIKGEFYPCKPDVFEATYEKI